MLLNIFWSRTDKIMEAYATKIVTISSRMYVCVYIYIYIYISSVMFTSTKPALLSISVCAVHAANLVRLASCAHNAVWWLYLSSTKDQTPFA